MTRDQQQAYIIENKLTMTQKMMGRELGISKATVQYIVRMLPSRETIRVYVKTTPENYETNGWFDGDKYSKLHII